MGDVEWKPTQLSGAKETIPRYTWRHMAMLDGVGTRVDETELKPEADELMGSSMLTAVVGWGHFCSFYVNKMKNGLIQFMSPQMIPVVRIHNSYFPKKFTSNLFSAGFYFSSL